MRQSYILVSFLFLIIYSCRFPCDGFPDKDLIWLPYRIGDTIEYSDNIDTIEFTINNFFQSERSEERLYFPVMDIDCNEQAYFETNVDNTTGYKFKITAYSYPYSFDIEIQPEIPLSFYKNSKSKVDENVVATYFVVKDLNGIIFKDIYIVDIDLQNGKGSISSFILAAGYGILEFYDSKTQKTWKLIKN
jgi:hypothetical protein